MFVSRRLVYLAAGCLGSLSALGQIDPEKRDLIQFGYNGAIEGHQPVSAYVFYYHNQPQFLRTNLTLRLALGPTYLDSELGIQDALGKNTSLGIGLAGGGFADSYAEIRQGTYYSDQSFFGFGGGATLGVYHLFDPGRLIPLYGVLRGTVYYSTYADDKHTASDFTLPPNDTDYRIRTGLRWGGREPTLYPSLAMELSVWYQVDFRSGFGEYGFNDRSVSPTVQSFWCEAFLAYQLPGLHHNFALSLTAGGSSSADRFGAYRLGALLPLVAEFPLSLPGYYYQELSATSFALLGGNYMLPLDPRAHWNLNFTAASAYVNYLAGFEQPGNWNTGLGGGLLYQSGAWKVMVGYAYGVNAIRATGRGAQSIGILLQYDLARPKDTTFNPAQPNLWKGLQSVFGLFGN